jgi:hypothetical protein
MATYDAGTSVSLVATADGTSTFAGWTGACTGTGGCTLTMDAAKSVSATFTKISYTLSVTRSGGGTVSSTPAGIDCGNTCQAAYDAGTMVALTATPDAGSTFAGWSGPCTGTGSCVVTMDQARSVGATLVGFPTIVSTSVLVSTGSPIRQWIAASLVVRDADPGKSLTLSRVGDGTCPAEASAPTFSVASASIDSDAGEPVTVGGALGFFVASGDSGTYCVYLSITDGVLQSWQKVYVTVTP